MSVCNLCALKRMKKRCKDRGLRPALVYDPKWGGHSLLGVKKGVHAGKIKRDTPEWEDAFIAWFREIGNTCCC